MVEPVVSAGAVGADEYDRLRRNHAALQDQFEAATEVLRAVGRSAGDVDAVMTTIVESVCRLCRSDAAHLYLLDQGLYRMIKAFGLSEESIDYFAEHPMPVDRGTLVGRVALDRKTQQIPDVLADPSYGRLDLQRVAGFRTTIGAPMLLDDEVVGALAGVAQRGRSLRRARDGDRRRRSPARRRWRSTRASGPRAGGAAGASSPARSSSSRR